MPTGMADQATSVASFSVNKSTPPTNAFFFSLVCALTIECVCKKFYFIFKNLFAWFFFITLARVSLFSIRIGDSAVFGIHVLVRVLF